MRLWWQGIVAPRDAAAEVIGWQLPRAALMPLAGLISVLASILLVLQEQISGPMVVRMADGSLQEFPISPVILALIGYAAILGGAWAIGAFGRAIGGRGGFEASLALGIYLQAILLGLQALVLFFLLLVPPVAALVGIASIVIRIWLTLQFIDVLHGFGSLVKSFFLAIAVLTAVGLAMMLVLTLSGVRLAG